MLRVTVSFLLAAGLAFGSHAEAQVPAPSEVLGFEPGDDYQLGLWGELLPYYEALAAASDRVELREIGETVLGKPLIVLFISSPENLAALDRHRENARALAHAEISEEEAIRISREGKAVVWIDAGLHATEVAPPQMTPLLAHRVATEDSEEMRKIRDEVILILMPCMNPDGLDIVASWYRRNLKTPFETTRPPELYHHYVGHDNNRDWFMNNMPETAAVSRMLYHEWFPQIVYNHHQTGPAWARIFLPPFADPVNPRIHPGVTTSVNLIGSAMANRFAMKKMPGAVSDMIYSMWWNGGMRTVPYFHNMIGLLTETSHASASPRVYDPADRPEFVGNPRRGQAAPTNGTDVFYPYPWQGGESPFSDPIRYTLTASMAVLDVAADLREKWLFDIWRMGRDAIEGSKASWIVPADQWDPGEAAALVNVLYDGGIVIERAEESFEIEGQTYGEGSYIIPGAQAFRAYAEDLLEAQDYPDRRRTPDGPPDPPYDLAGWTLPMQMGVRVDRVAEVPEVTSARVDGAVRAPAGEVSGGGSFGYAISHRPNAAVIAQNRLLAAGAEVAWAAESFGDGGTVHSAGTLVVRKSDPADAAMEGIASELGLDVAGLSRAPDVELLPLEPVRVGLYKSYVASMDEGWTRWLLENYEYDLTNLSDDDVRTGDLSRLDVIVLPHQSTREILQGHAPGTMPDEFTGGIGLEGSLALSRFVEEGGMLVTLDGASDFAIAQFGLPLRNVTAGLAERTFFIPGSLIRATVDTAHPLAFGMRDEVATQFVRSRAFETVSLPRTREGGRETTMEPPPANVEVIARYAEDDILMSGWALGEENTIGGKIAMARVPMGAGEVVLFGFRPQFRGQPRGTYKLFLNALNGAAVEDLGAR